IVPRAGLTGPVQPIPIPLMSPGNHVASRDTWRIDSDNSASPTEKPRSERVSKVTRAWISPEELTAATIILVPPMSIPIARVTGSAQELAQLHDHRAVDNWDEAKGMRRGIAS